MVMIYTYTMYLYKCYDNTHNSYMLIKYKKNLNKLKSFKSESRSRNTWLMSNDFSYIFCGFIFTHKCFCHSTRGFYYIW